MTRHKHAQTGLVTPSPLDHWIDATLRAFAMLVLHVASTLQMICRRTRVNATRATPTELPQAKIDTHQETDAVQQDGPTNAHPEQRSSAARPSKDERALTTASHKLPQHREHRQFAHPSLRSSRRKSGPRAPSAMCVQGLDQQPQIPAFAGTSGENITAPNKNAAT